VNTEITGVQKIILHPALVDTRLGCEIIELDRFIFSYIASNVRQRNDDELDTARAQHALYGLARYERIRSQTDAGGQQWIDGRVSQLVDANRTGMQKVLPAGQGFEIIQGLPSVYAPELAQLTQTCARESSIEYLLAPQTPTFPVLPTHGTPISPCSSQDTGAPRSHLIRTTCASFL
jgi:hypothetical protein